MSGSAAIVAITSVEYHAGLKDLPTSIRPRERLVEVGPGHLSDAELLAILLRTGRQGENVLELAAGLLARFGDLAAMERATLSELRQHKGLGPVKAVEIKAALELGRRLGRLLPRELRTVKSPSDVAVLVADEMSLLEQEHLRVALLNTRNRVIDIKPLYKGSLNSTTVRVAEVFRDAIRDQANAIILIHNHPSGDPTPSPEDVRLTSAVREAGALMDIELLDHVVIGRPGWVSLRERGLGFSTGGKG